MRAVIALLALTAACSAQAAPPPNLLARVASLNEPLLREARVASAQARDARVREYAGLLLDDHGQLSERLAVLAPAGCHTSCDGRGRAGCGRCSLRSQLPRCAGEVAPGLVEPAEPGRSRGRCRARYLREGTARRRGRSPAAGTRPAGCAGAAAGRRAGRGSRNTTGRRETPSVPATRPAAVTATDPPTPTLESESHESVTACSQSLDLAGPVRLFPGRGAAVAAALARARGPDGGRQPGQSAAQE